jgi:hypothetical protein
MKDRKLIRLLPVIAAVAAPFVMTTSAYAERSKSFEQRFSAGFLQNLTQNQVVMGIPTGATQRVNLVIGSGAGSLGRGQTIAVTKSGPPISAAPCPAGLIKVADIVSNNILWTFEDLSMLYGDGTGVVCLDPAAPSEPPSAEIEGTWLGGTGRYEDVVGGDFSIRFTFFEVISPETQFNAETGIVTGTVVWD